MLAGAAGATSLRRGPDGVAPPSLSQRPSSMRSSSRRRARRRVERASSHEAAPTIAVTNPSARASRPAVERWPVESARAAVTAARNDAEVARHAPQELERATQLLNSAETAATKRSERELAAHYDYLAEQTAKLAVLGRRSAAEPARGGHHRQRPGRDRRPLNDPGGRPRLREESAPQLRHPGAKDGSRELT